MDMKKDIPDKNMFRGLLAITKLNGVRIISYPCQERGVNDAFFTITNNLVPRNEHQDDNYSPIIDD
jgi:hypothetical protein